MLVESLTVSWAAAQCRIWCATTFQLLSLESVLANVLLFLAKTQSQLSQFYIWSIKSVPYTRFLRKSSRFHWKWEISYISIQLFSNRFVYTKITQFKSLEISDNSNTNNNNTICLHLNAWNTINWVSFACVMRSTQSLSVETWPIASINY